LYESNIFIMAAITTAAIGAGLGIVQAIGGAKQKKDAKNAINNYDRVDISADANPYRDIQLSTVGSDLATEETQRMSASALGALQGGGIRGILGGLPQLVSATNSANRNTAVDLDRQNQDRQLRIAQGEERLLGMRENRDIQNLNNLSSQYNAGNKDMWSGISGIGSGLISGLSQFGGFTPQVSSPNALNPSGTTPLSGGANISTSLPNKLF
jgi:type II secretory pathway pseudopilin PulG